MQEIDYSSNHGICEPYLYLYADLACLTAVEFTMLWFSIGFPVKNKGLLLSPSLGDNSDGSSNYQDRKPPQENCIILERFRDSLDFTIYAGWYSGPSFHCWLSPFENVHHTIVPLTIV